MALSASFKTVWAREMQEVFWPQNVWSPQANFRLEKELKGGDTIKRLIPSKMVPQNYTRYNDVNFQTGTTTAEQLQVTQTPTIPFVISDLDELQSTPAARQTFTNMASEQMNIIINGFYTAEVVNAASKIDASDFGGTAGNGAVVTPSNIQKLFAMAQKKAGRKNVMRYGPGMAPGAANLTPDVYQALLEYLAGKESVLGDRTGENGHAGQYMGYDLYVHNGGYWTGTLNLATNPTAGDTLTLQVQDQTLVFTFVSSIGATPGNVLIGGSAAATGANLAALLTAPGTTTANGVALVTDAQALLFGTTASYGSNVLTITAKGAGAIITTSSLTATTDGWVVGKNISNLLFTQKGAIDFVVQRYPKIQIDQAENRIEEWKIKPYTLFGVKTFSDGAKKMINVKVDTTSYT